MFISRRGYVKSSRLKRVKDSTAHAENIIASYDLNIVEKRAFRGRPINRVYSNGLSLIMIYIGKRYLDS